MKKYFLIIYLFIFCLNQSVSLSEIKDRRIWDNLYSSCMGEFDPSFTFTKQEFKNYCTCTSNKVTERFTVKELVLLESKITKSSKNDEVKTLLANKKMENIVAECVSRIIN